MLYYIYMYMYVILYIPLLGDLIHLYPSEHLYFCSRITMKIDCKCLRILMNHTIYVFILGIHTYYTYQTHL